MALFPCEVHGGRYRGKQASLYVAVGGESEVDRVKVRLCGDCLEGLVDRELSKLVQVVSDGEVIGGYQIPFECTRCDTVAECVPVFVTAYPIGEGQSQWFARLCPACAAEMREALLPPIEVQSPASSLPAMPALGPRKAPK